LVRQRFGTGVVGGLALCILSLVLLAATSCAGSDAGGAAGAPNRATGTTVALNADGATIATAPDGKHIVKIGALVSQTGAGAPYGASQLHGIQLGVDQLNQRGTIPGVTFELVVRDDHSDADQAKVALTDLIDKEGIVALFGPTLSSVAAKVDRIAVAAGVPVMAVSNTTLDILTVGDPAWRVALTDPALAEQNLTLVRERFGVRKVALVWDPNDRRSRDLADRFREAATKAGVEVKGEVAFTGGSSDFGTTVRQAEQLGVEGLLVAADDTDARRFFGTVAQGSTRLDFNTIGNSVWRVALSERTVIPKTVAGVKAKVGISRVVLVSDPSDQYSKGAADAFRAGAQASGITIVQQLDYTSGRPTDFASAFDAAKRGAVDGFFVSALSAEAKQFLEQRAAAGLTAVPVVGGDGFADNELLRELGPAAANLFIGGDWLAPGTGPLSTTFTSDYTAAYRATPDQWAALGYAGVELITAAMHQGNDSATRATIRTELGALRDVPTVVGPVTFSDLREAQFPGVVLTVRDGTFVAFT
jgi:ABC-type branched-subunit amino acid transport system substrate-binding protein